MQSALEVTHAVSANANNAVHLSMVEGIQRRLDEFGELILQVCERGCGQSAQPQRVRMCLLVCRMCLESLSPSREASSRKEDCSSSSDH